MTGWSVGDKIKKFTALAIPQKKKIPQNKVKSATSQESKCSRKKE